MKSYLETVREMKGFAREIGEWSLEMIYSEDKVAVDAGKIINRKAHQKWETLHKVELELQSKKVS